MNKKLLTADQLKRLAQGLDSRIDSAVLKENTRAAKEETRLDTKINNTTEMLGGKSFVYLTSVEYERLSDADKNDESKVYIITDAEDVSHSHDNKDFLDKLSDERVLILTETIILKSSGNKLYEISITPDGNLTTELITSGTEEEIILKDQFGTLFKLSVNNSGTLFLDKTTDGEYRHIYMQAKYPYAEIFKLGIHTDDGVPVIIASSLNQNFIKDTSAYNNYTWSSIRILEQIDAAKEEITNKIDTEISQKIDGIDFSSYATKAEVQEFDDYAYAQIIGMREDIGTLANLQTTNKGNLVAAINEVFQSGANTKQQLVDVLRAKGITTVSASSSWANIINALSSPDFIYGEGKWYVENVSGAQYNFKSISDGYYESTNQGKNNSYALCKLVISNPSKKNVYMLYINSAETDFDFGIVSNLNTTLSLSSNADTNYLHKCTLSSTEVQVLSLGKVEGFYYIKYRKDNTDSAGNDSFRFKIVID